MMVDWSRATRDEITVLTAALDSYEVELKRAQARHPSSAVRNNALWRLHVIEQYRQAIDAR